LRQQPLPAVAVDGRITTIPGAEFCFVIGTDLKRSRSLPETPRKSSGDCLFHADLGRLAARASFFGLQSRVLAQFWGRLRTDVLWSRRIGRNGQFRTSAGKAPGYAAGGGDRHAKYCCSFRLCPQGRLRLAVETLRAGTVVATVRRALEYRRLKPGNRALPPPFDLSKACASHLSHSSDTQTACALSRWPASRNGWQARRD
jgi:hypothetical protein